MLQVRDLPRFCRIVLLAASGACAGSAPGVVDGRPTGETRSAEDEAAELCRLHVDRTEADELRFDRRMAVESWKLSSGILPSGVSAANVGRLHAEAHGRCLDQVLSALEGPGGTVALRILHEARVSCESAPDSATSALARRCIHVRKLELFEAGDTQDRETLDRLLQVGGGEPLSDAQRAEYCRTRELGGTGHPFCD